MRKMIKVCLKLLKSNLAYIIHAFSFAQLQLIIPTDVVVCLKDISERFMCKNKYTLVNFYFVVF